MNPEPMVSGDKPRRANQRGAARLAAVQALYQMDVGGTGLDETISEFESLRLGHQIEGETYLKADPAFFRVVVAGVVEDQKELDPLIHKTLSDSWPLHRIDTTLRAILRAGAFEIGKRRDVPARVAINEYVDIARAFFEDDEPGIVNAVLDAIARKMRPEEFT